jgi:hypothetical protein
MKAIKGVYIREPKGYKDMKRLSDIYVLPSHQKD